MSDILSLVALAGMVTLISWLVLAAHGGRL
jgi:hypothetical protein